METVYKKISKATASVIMILLFINFTTGCYYYKVQTYPQINAEGLQKYDSVGKYLIVHKADSAWHLSELKINDQTFSGSISPLPEVHQKYKTTIADKPNRYKKHSEKNNESDVIKEVHLYMTNLVSEQDTSISGRLSSVEFVAEYMHDKKKTTTSWVLSCVLIPVIGIPVILFIIAAIAFKSGGPTKGISIGL